MFWFSVFGVVWALHCKTSVGMQMLIFGPKTFLQELDVKERSVEASSKVAEQTKRERLAEIVKREGKLADAEKAVEEREAAARDALRSEREAIAKLDGLAERERACDERERLLESKRSEVIQPSP
jgi:hypothetical protein